MSVSERSKLRVVPYNIIVVILFLVVMPFSFEPAIVLFGEIPGYLLGVTNLGLVGDWKVILSPDYAVDFSRDHWYNVFESEKYWEYASNLGIAGLVKESRTDLSGDGFFVIAFFVFGLPFMIIMTYVILKSNESIPKYGWFFIMIISAVIGLVSWVLLSFAQPFFCPQGYGLCGAFSTPLPWGVFSQTSPWA